MDFLPPSPPGYEGANKFIRNSPIRIFLQLDVCQLCSSQVEQISNVLSLFSLLFCYRMHFKTINPITQGRFMIETEILIFPLGYKCLLPFFLHSSSCSKPGDSHSSPSLPQNPLSDVAGIIFKSLFKSNILLCSCLNHFITFAWLQLVNFIILWLIGAAY